MSQLDKAAIIAQLDSVINTNGVEAITGVILNSMLRDIIDSSPNTITESSLLGLNDWSAVVTYSVGDTVMNGGTLYQANTTPTFGVFTASQWDVVSGDLQETLDISSEATITKVMSMIVNPSGAFPANTYSINIEAGQSPTPTEIYPAGVSSFAPGGVKLQANDTNTNGFGELFLNPDNSIIRQFKDGVLGTGEVSVNIRTTGAEGVVIKDDHFSKGAIYDADYSANYVNRSLVDKEYVDTKAVPASLSAVSEIATATYNNTQEFIDTTNSSGWIAGGDITDNGNQTVAVALGQGLIRATDDPLANLLAFDWASVASIAVADGETRFIVVDYNAGSPEVQSTTTFGDWNQTTRFTLGAVVREGLDIHITQVRQTVNDASATTYKWIAQTNNKSRDSLTGGLILSETGTRNIVLSAGAVWISLNRFSIAAQDTSASDTIDRYYRDGVGGWTKEAAETQWNNTQYDDGSGTLATMTNNRWSVAWFYIEADDGRVIMVYGQSEETSEAAVEALSPPASVPPRINLPGVLVGRIIFQKNAATGIVESAFDTSFSGALVTDHGNLSGLGDDDHTQYHTDARAESWLNGNDIFLDSDNLGIGITPTHKLHLSLNNTNTIPEVKIDQLGTGDSGIWFNTVAQSWSIGIDNSDNDSFKIARSNTVDTNVQMILETSGEVAIGLPSAGATLDVNQEIRVTNGASKLTGYSDSLTEEWTIEDQGTYTLFYRTNAGEELLRLYDNQWVELAESGAQVGIGTGGVQPGTSVGLEIGTTTKALLLSRMTTTQRNALTAVNGMIIYNNTTNAFNFYENGSWVTK
jgi:hypothetical protein